MFGQMTNLMSMYYWERICCLLFINITMRYKSQSTPVLIHFRYEDTVVGQFFGHAHTSFYEVFYDDVNFTRPISVMHIPGSITTYTSNNPGYRIYEMDGNYAGSSWVCSGKWLRKMM